MENVRSEQALEAWMQKKISQSVQEEETGVHLHSNILGCLSFCSQGDNGESHP